jgi:predicted SAM-dependent methyltransferase
MKLDICGGNTKIYGDFLNVDIMPGPKTNIVADIRKSLPFKDGQVEEILSVATLEHLLIEQTNRLIMEFYRILEPGGKLTIAVPDLKKICQAYIDHTASHTMIIKYIYGELFENSPFEFQCHKSIYDYGMMFWMLNRAGFVGIEEVPYDFPMHSKEFMMKIICKKNG